MWSQFLGNTVALLETEYSRWTITQVCIYIDSSSGKDLWPY